MSTNDAGDHAGSARSRPGSSTATRVVEGSPVAEREVMVSRVKVAKVALGDRSLYFGEVDAEGVPDGVGVVESVFGSTYAGAIKDGRKQGSGVELSTNGTSFSGDFAHNEPNGYGVYTGALGSKYIGQWENGTRHGVGVAVDADAVMTAARYDSDEPVLASCEEEPPLSWEQDVEQHILLAAIAERAAGRGQEAARQRQLETLVQEMTAIGPEALDTTASIEAFEAKEEYELEEFLRDQSDELDRVNAAAGELKFAEAQLLQRQKELRNEITTRREELTRMAKYVVLAETRAVQVRDAERTLDTLQRQLDVLGTTENI